MGTQAIRLSSILDKCFFNKRDFLEKASSNVLVIGNKSLSVFSPESGSASYILGVALNQGINIRRTYERNRKASNEYYIHQDTH